MKYLILALLALVLAGCSGDGTYTGDSAGKYTPKCIDGVQYIVFHEWGGNHGFGYMSVKFNRDGTIATCGN